jgi:hypothetical protein
MNLKNHTNDYQQLLGAVFEDTPKAVLAAIACSAYEQLGIHQDDFAAQIAYEWRCLFNGGVVPNKPPSRVLQAARSLDLHGEE